MRKLEIFFIGIITALGAMLFQFSISIITPGIIEENISGMNQSMIAIILVEEFFKLAVIWKTSQRYQLKKAVFLNSILIGVGFSFAEILLNIFNYSAVITFLIPAYFGLILIHTSTSALFGYYFSRKSDWTILGMIFVFLSAFFLHFLYNAFVAYEFNYLIVYAILITTLVFLFFKIFKK